MRVRSRGAHAPRPTRAVLWTCGLLAPLSADLEPAAARAPCAAGAAAARVFAGSRLLPAEGERLELARGRELDCRGPRARRVLAPLTAALAREFPLERLPAPLSLHVDPQLPADQAPLRGIEVHVSSREILVDASALATLPAEAWRHEALHTLAPPPPAADPAGKRLWLTLEEALVLFLGQASGAPAGSAPAAPELAPQPIDAVLAPAAPELAPRPIDAVLASPAYDPHPLAAGLARELLRGGPRSDPRPWLDCLSARPAPAEASATTAPELFARFAGRCAPAARQPLERALARWWPAPTQAEIPIASTRAPH